MTVPLVKDDVAFENPDCLPLEDLKFKIKSDGVTREIKAFSAYWVETRFHARYPGAPKSGNVEEEQWLNNMKWYNKELEWMLNLRYFKFWSSMAFDTGCIVSLVSFLQEASPFYSTFEHENEFIKEAYSLAYRRVLLIFCRLITNKESEKSWMRTSVLAKLLYDYSLITIPILWDIVAVYGRSNKIVLSRITDAVFKMQPKYYDDLKIAYEFLKDKVFTTIEGQANGFSAMSPSSPIEQYNSEPKPSETILGDLALHLLDCATTMRFFFELYAPAKTLCRDLKMYISIANLYDNCIPTICNKSSDKNSLKNLDYARVDLIECYRLIINTCTEEALTDPSNAIKPAELFLEILSETLNVLTNQKAFVADLLVKQPLQNDLEVLRQICEDLDPVKCDFILQSLMSSLDDFSPIGETKSMNDRFSLMNKTKASSSIVYDDEEGACGGYDPGQVNYSQNIAEVTDVFPHLGTGYIRRLLDYYGSSENVISAVLEDNMPEALNVLDKTEPLIPPDPAEEELFTKLGNTHLNAFDGDDFDMRVRDVPKGHWIGKGKRGPKNVNELLDDKSYIKEMKIKYQQYDMVYDNMYDDEYDDSYEGPSKPVTEEGPDSNLRRPKEIPRVLRKQSQDESESEEEGEPTEIRSSSNPPTKFQPFCENPEAVRARWEAKRTGKMPSRDVVGKPKGQGQEKDVAINRDKKNTNKSSRANHNRRQGAQWKRSRGMMPS